MLNVLAALVHPYRSRRPKTADADRGAAKTLVPHHMPRGLPAAAPFEPLSGLTVVDQTGELLVVVLAHHGGRRRDAARVRHIDLQRPHRIGATALRRHVSCRLRRCRRFKGVTAASKVCTSGAQRCTLGCGRSWVCFRSGHAPFSCVRAASNTLRPEATSFFAKPSPSPRLAPASCVFQHMYSHHTGSCHMHKLLAQQSALPCQQGHLSPASSPRPFGLQINTHNCTRSTCTRSTCNATRSSIRSRDQDCASPCGRELITRIKSVFLSL